MTFPISLIVAMARNHVIGRDNHMPWHLPEDLKFFKATTMAKPMIMGRKTFDSIGRPLPGRKTIVVTRDPRWTYEGVLRAGDIDSALQMAEAWLKTQNGDEIIVAGGAEIYRQTLDRASRLYLTEIAADPDGDTYFPEIDRADWTEVSRKSGQGEDPSYAFVTLERRNLA